MDWGSIIGGIGIGGIAITILNQYLTAQETKKERIFNKKEQAYLGLLHAIHHAALMPSDKSSKDYALWQAKVYLVGSPEVIKYAQLIVDTNDNREERVIALKGLNDAMREDLGIDNRNIC